MASQPRRHSVAVSVGKVKVGGDHPIVVQSMTNTDTADVDGTIAQVAALSRAGSEMVRITVDREEAAAEEAMLHDEEEADERRARRDTPKGVVPPEPIVPPAPIIPPDDV